MSNPFRIEVNGVLWETFTSAEVYKSIEAASGEFLFRSSDVNPDFEFPFSKGDECVIYIGEKKIITGYIDEVGGEYGADFHELKVKGRDKTQDIIDSSINGNMDLQTPINLEKIIEKVLDLNNINDIEVINNESLRSFSANEKVRAETEENAFSFLEKYCRKRQVLLTTNADGNIVITRAGNNKYTTVLKSVKGEADNNILTASFSDSDSNRYNTYIVKSQGNMLSSILDDKLSGKSGKAFDENIREGRVLVINSNLSTDIQTNNDRAIWESNIRRARGFNYQCRVQGYFLDFTSQILIEPNNLINVHDSKFGINKEMLIKSCRYLKSNEGSFTEIELVNKDAYTLKAEQDEIEAKFDFSNKFADLGF